jgi:hypothetical protein
MGGMSKSSRHAIACPFCHAERDVELWDVLNIDHNPELRAEILQNRLNRVDCPSCGKAFRVDKPLFYRDPEQEIFIHYDPPTAERPLEAVFHDFEEAKKQLQSLLPADVPAPELHLVLNWNELVERIFLLEEGLDEKIVEHIKYMIYKANPDRIAADAKNLLFDAEDSTDDQLRFIVQDRATRKLEAQLDFARADYEALFNLYSDDHADLLDQWFPGPYVNGRIRFLADRQAETLDDPANNDPLPGAAPGGHGHDGGCGDDGCGDDDCDCGCGHEHDPDSSHPHPHGDA